MTSSDRQDLQHLKLLSTFHYVVGGLTGALSLVFLGHVGVGLAFILTPQEVWGTGGGDSPPAWFGWVFLISGLLVVSLGLTIATVMVISGRFLAQQRRYRFSFAVACLECLVTPFGTALGILTIIMLSKPAVKALYGLNQ